MHFHLPNNYGSPMLSIGATKKKKKEKNYNYINKQEYLFV